MALDGDGMKLNELYDECAADLSWRELTAFHSHLVGGLVQQIEMGVGGKKAAARAIESARTYAIRDRVIGGVSA